MLMKNIAVKTNPCLLISRINGRLEKFAVYAGLRFDRYKKYGGHHEFLTTGYVKDDEEGICNAWSPRNYP